ncbi:MAG: hypothetical protein P0S94_05390 [Simkaniaceae bacterium]|nr:hypothetical protein [Simkaniaceae bacterium]
MGIEINQSTAGLSENFCFIVKKSPQDLYELFLKFAGELTPVYSNVSTPVSLKNGFSYVVIWINRNVSSNVEYPRYFISGTKGNNIHEVGTFTFIVKKYDKKKLILPFDYQMPPPPYTPPSKIKGFFRKIFPTSTPTKPPPYNAQPPQ